jgi:hydrogenase-4 component E
MDWLLVGAILAAFVILGTEKLSACVYAVALQGACLSLIPFLAESGHIGRAWLIFLLTFLVKAVVIPFLLFRSLKRVTIRNYSEFLMRPHLALLAGGGLVVLSFSSVRFLPQPGPLPTLNVPIALSIVLIGFFLLVARTRALSQVIGFLVMENGIFLFGLILAAEFPMVVELGVLLDLLAAILVMGIMVYHIHQTFDHIDTRFLSTLKDAE